MSASQTSNRHGPLTLSFQAGWQRTKWRLSFFLHPTTSIITSFSIQHIICSRQASWSSLTMAIHAISTSSSSFVIIRIRVPHTSRLFERWFNFGDLLMIWPFALMAYFFSPRTQIMHQQLTACPILFSSPSTNSFHCRYMLHYFLCVYCGDLYFFVCSRISCARSTHNTIVLNITVRPH